MICFDWIFPEAVLALQGADVIAHPANLVLPHCPRAMPIRALENHYCKTKTSRIRATGSGCLSGSKALPVSDSKSSM